MKLPQAAAVGCASALAFGWARPAAADTATVQPLPGRKQAAPQAENSSYRHTGFRGRFDLGVGRLFASSSAPNRTSRHFSGTTLSLALSLGWEFAGPCAVGGTFGLDRVYGLSGTETGSGSLDTSGLRFMHRIFALSVDCYARRDGGFRAFGGVGISTLDVEVRGENQNATQDPSPDPSGAGYFAGVGWDSFVDERVSLGILAKLEVLPLGVQELQGVDTSVLVLIPVLGVSLSFD